MGLQVLFARYLLVFFFFVTVTIYLETQTQGAGYFRTFWVGMCCWDHGTLSLYQR